MSFAVVPDFPSDALQCVDIDGNQLKNNTAMSLEDHLQVNCTYSGIYPRSDLAAYIERKEEPFEFVNRTEATEKNERFSMKIEIDR